MHEYAHRRMAEEIDKKVNREEMTQLLRLLEKIEA